MLALEDSEDQGGDRLDLDLTTWGHLSREPGRALSEAWENSTPCQEPALRQ